VRYRRSWCGIGRQRVWPLTDIDTVRIRRKKKILRWFEILRNPELTGDDGITNQYPFFVHFSNPKEESLGVIPDLLEGEARWIATQIREKSRTLPKPE